jgi:hypothetical protein
MKNKFILCIALLTVGFCFIGINNFALSATCTDSDGGEIYGTKGILIIGINTYADACYPTDANYLSEYYCDAGGKLSVRGYKCPNGCLNGACKATGTCIPKWEIDPASKCINSKQLAIYKDINNCGVLIGKPANEGTIIDCKIACISKWVPSAWSACVGGVKTKIYSDANSCSPATSNKPVNETQACNLTCTSIWRATAWTPCYNGKQARTYEDVNKCAVPKPLKPADEDRICCTSNWQPSAWSTCKDNTKTRTYEDKNNCNVSTSIKPANETQNCTVSTTCTDSDNGSTYEVRGITSARGEIYTDYCDNINPNYLYEYYCDVIGRPMVKNNYKCPNGCENGACKTITCTPAWEINPSSKCVNRKKLVIYRDANNCAMRGNPDQTGKPADDGTIIDCETKCTSNWQALGFWSICADGKQTRAYEDISKCEVSTSTKPEDETRACDSVCTSSWQPSAWSTCRDNTQTRAYEDISKCEVSTSAKPANEARSCTTSFACISKWVPSAWSACVGGVKTKIYSDTNNCKTPSSTRPVNETQSCTPTPTPCVPKWQPGEWSVCENGKQSQTFTDINKCSNTVKTETRNCSTVSKPNITQPPTVNVKINNSDGPLTLIIGSKATLTWTSENATSCGGSSSQSALRGTSEIIVKQGQKTYTANCANSAGTTDDKVTIFGTTGNIQFVDILECPDTSSGIIYFIDKSSISCQQFIGKIPQR